MTDITPSALQAQAIAATTAWFKTADKKQQQVFRIFGYAGTGKTTILNLAIKELGLSAFCPVGDDMKEEADTGGHQTGRGVLYAAFTGKAALVMSRKGTPAQTIHSLIYRVSEPTKEEMERVKKEIADIEGKLGALGPAERMLMEAQASQLKLRLKDMHKPAFILNTESAVRDASLIVLDEVSMVGDDMARDLLSFGKPILVLGDPGQLPPIKGEGYFVQAEPNVMLTEIHRQAGESAIIRLATMARQGQPIPYGQHDDFVWKMRRLEVSPEHMLRGGQVICGKNATRMQLNNAMRQAAGFSSIYPTGGGEKIICLKNRNDLGVVNGMFLTLTDIEDVSDISFRARVMTEDGKPVGALDEDGKPEKQILYKGHFDDHVRVDKDRDQRDYFVKRGLMETSWGWAITGHKSQGSQWENIVVVDDGLGRTMEDRSRWLYTAITRAEKGLVLLG